MLIFVTGKSGVGKSYFASMLADKLNLKYVNVDVVSKSIYNERIAMQSRLQIVCKLRAVMCACITSCFV